MSSVHVGVETFNTSVTVPDDADSASVVATADETSFDNTIWLRARMRDARRIPFGAFPINESVGGSFALNFNLMGLGSTTTGEDFRVPLLGLVNGATLDGVTMTFVPKDNPTRTAGTTPGTNVSIIVARYQLGSEVTPAVASVVGTASYTPVSAGNYGNGKMKLLTLSGLAHTIDTTGYAYMLIVTDEDGADATAGNIYLTFAVNYS